MQQNVQNAKKDLSRETSNIMKAFCECQNFPPLLSSVSCQELRGMGIVVDYSLLLIKRKRMSVRSKFYKKICEIP